MNRNDNAGSLAGPASGEPAIRHVVLIGDALGTLARIRGQGAGALESKLRPGASPSWKLTILPAGDLARRSRLLEFPADATHVLISVEGNRAIETSGLLEGQPASYQEGLARLSFAADQFEDVIEGLIYAAQTTGLPTVICTMWLPRYVEPVRQRAAAAALAIFNDRILRRAVEARISVVDLRGVATEAGDYADQTLMSKAGLQKAASVVWRALQEVSRGGGKTEMFY
jgi:hypothetical protein